MRIAIGSDHRGRNLKRTVINLLIEIGQEYKDFGSYGTAAVDYPDFAREIGEAVARGEFDRGILICSTGIGMSIAANKVRRVRAAVCTDAFCARRARQHNNANVLCMGEGVVGKGLAEDIVRTFLNTEFEGGRHIRRLSKIDAIEAGK